MTYHADKVTNIRIDDSRRFPVISGEVAEGYETVQFYIAGALADVKAAVNGRVSFTGAVPGDIDPFFLLSVDPADALINYWDDAFPTAATSGNRIKIQVATTEDMKIGFRWRISIDGTKVYENDIYPSSDGQGGYGVSYGMLYGHGPFGGGYGISYGVNYGHGGPIVLEWVSEPQVIGSYAVTVNIIDKAGNISTAASSSVTIATYARPASGLAVAGYVSGTDTLSLTWTESEDL